MFSVIDHFCEEHLEEGEEEEQHHLPPFTILYGSVRFCRHCLSCPSPDHRRRQWGDWMIRISHLDDGHGAETGLIDDDDLWFPQLSINFNVDLFWSSDFVVSSKSQLFSPVSKGELFRYLVIISIVFPREVIDKGGEPGWFHLVPRPSQRSRDINQEIST